MRESVLAVKSLAYRAGQGISFDPEKFGEGLLRDLENGLNSFLPQIPQEFRVEYEKRYIAKFCEWMQALSRTYSVMITGAGNFNNKRHEKMNRYERSAYDRFTTWRDKVLKRLNREKRLVGWEEVERLQEKLERLTELQEKMKAVNKIVRSKKMSDVEQYEELEALGLSKELINEVMAEPQYCYLKKGFQQYQLSNNNAKIKATEEAIRRHTAMAETEDSEIPFEGGKVGMCYSEERIRIYFDEKPNPEMIKKLKESAFKWSPSNMAWQRQLTTNAKYATKRLLGIEI